MRDYLTKQLKHVESIDYNGMGDDLRAMLREIELKGSKAGMPAIVSACQIRGGPISITLARQVLAECLSHCPVDAPTALIPADVAKELAVSPDTVLKWINDGLLKAANIAKGHRPRWIIQRSALADFLASREPQPVSPARKRRKLSDNPFKKYRD